MRVVFCDDDPYALAQLYEYVRDFFQNTGWTETEYVQYTTGDELLRNESRPDIAFLDVEMPGTSGIHIGAELKKMNPSIKIFIVTAYPDYLDEAMKFQVFRYLSKPVDQNRLYRNLRDAVYAYNMESREYPILTNDGVFIRRAEEIICVETANRKTVVYTASETLVSNSNIDYWRQTLTLPCFYATHRSYIVNMKYVYTIGKDSVVLKRGETEIEAFLSRRKYTQFKNTYLLYLESVR